MDNIEYTKKVIIGDVDGVHNRIYYSSNEDLKNLLARVYMKDKKVLTVLASSDQLFHIYEKKPLSVDTFDINCLTKYYYYLRKWAILYKDEYYFNVFSNENIYNLLCKVRVHDEEEEEAYNYWSRYIGAIPYFLTNDLFYYSSNAERNKIKDLKELKQALLEYKFNFKCMDISKDRNDSKYDIIIVSNILEYYDFCDQFDDIRDNLHSMLNEDGKIITTNYMHTRPSVYELRSFIEKFQYFDIFDSDYKIGTTYKKRKC